MTDSSCIDPLILLREEMQIDALRPFQVYGENIKWGLVKVVFPRDGFFEYANRHDSYSPTENDIKDAARIAYETTTPFKEEDLALLFYCSRLARDRIIVFVNIVSKDKIEREVYSVFAGFHDGGGGYVVEETQQLQTDPNLRLNNCWLVETCYNKTRYCRATEAKFI